MNSFSCGCTDNHSPLGVYIAGICLHFERQHNSHTHDSLEIVYIPTMDFSRDFMDACMYIYNIHTYGYVTSVLYDLVLTPNY